MSNLFFLLSGEHPTLPSSELKAILEAEGHEYQVLENLPQVLRIKADVESIKSVEFRSAMTRVCGVELLCCPADAEEIFKMTRSAPMEEFIRKGESFAVRVRRVRESALHLLGMELERKLGELISNTVKGVKVDLTNPQRTFTGVLTDNRFVFGLRIAEISAKPFSQRRPRKRPFFHPSAMPPKLARCMVNLARPKVGDLVLDPFCGTASMLIEAGLIGCRVLGLDAKPRMVRGSLRNLRHYGVKPEGMIVADALKPPTIKADCVVTDPPYGRSATTIGRETSQIIKDSLSTLQDCLAKGRRICVAAPKSVKAVRLGEEFGLKHVESHFVYIHRSLTREIAVFERS
ncbi:MAG: THUMP domain-containing protein [Candidatus Bathyarchaeia archaeon]